MSRRYDYLLVGGGLQSGLLALALRHYRPTKTIAIVERDTRLGGNHTWSFHAGDVPRDARVWFEPLIKWRWPGYDVIFPGYRRRVDEPYGALSGEHLDAVIRSRLANVAGCDIVTGADAVRVHPRGVTLSDGRELTANVVVDSRGPERTAAPRRTGYQKFLGLEVRLQSRHGLTHPLLMDTLVPQVEGMRFMYVLPLEADRVLVEDTYFANQPELHAHVLRARVHSWIAARGWQIAEVLREERGVLPMPYENATTQESDVPLCGGYAGGWFNPATGYSLPLALRFASFIATHEPETLRGPKLTRLIAERDQQAGFLLLLNRLLFEATPANARRNIFERFYRLPTECINRFYAMQLLATDRARVLIGWPPPGVSLRKAIKAIGEWALPKERLQWT
jgi:lycopene beta-cyclase